MVQLSRHSSPGTDGRFLSQKLVGNGFAGTSWGRKEMVLLQDFCHHVSGESATVGLPNIPHLAEEIPGFPKDQTGGGKESRGVKLVFLSS